MYEKPVCFIFYAPPSISNVKRIHLWSSLLSYISAESVI